MLTAVDTNVLIDIFGADKKYGRSSAEALRRCMKEGAVCACEIVWTETATAFSNERDCLTKMHELAIEFSPITQKTAIKAGSIWRRYREAGGKRQWIVADFLIGTHALHQCDRLLTRDRGFYRDFLKPSKIIDPTAIKGR